jgi:hypothetical protein
MNLHNIHINNNQGEGERERGRERGEGEREREEFSVLKSVQIDNYSVGNLIFCEKQSSFS